MISGVSPDVLPDVLPGRARDVPARRGVTRWESARAIARHGYAQLGTIERGARIENARRFVREGQRAPIKILVSPRGLFFIENGRHRLHAAVELDAPILVTWARGHKGLDQPLASETWIQAPP